MPIIIPGTIFDGLDPLDEGEPLPVADDPFEEDAPQLPFLGTATPVPILPEVPPVQMSVAGIMKELPGSGEVTFTKAGVTGSRIFQIPWYDDLSGEYWLSKVTTMMGFTDIDPITGDPFVHLPDRFSADLPWLFAQELKCVGQDITGFDETNYGRITYRYMKITVKYGALNFGESFAFHGKTVKLQGGSMAFQYDNNFQDPTNQFSQISPSTDPDAVIHQDISAIFPLGEYSMERHQVTVPDFMRLISFLGKINSKEFFGNDPDNNTTVDFPPRTLQLISATAKKTYMANGTPVWDLAFKFGYNPNEWNRLYRPSKGEFWYFFNEQTQSYLFDQDDFSELAIYK